MATGAANTPAARALGAELRDARKRAGLSLRALAERLAAAKTQLSRWETGTSVPASEHVASFLTALGVTGDEYERILEQARNTDSRSWVSSGIPGVQKELASLVEFESTATRITEVAPLLIPGLLQTPDYMHASMAQLPDDQIRARILTRMERRTVLTKDGAPEFTALIGEAALREPLGGPAAMAAQLKHIEAEAATHPNVAVQVIPSGSQSFHAAHAGQFILLHFPKADPIVQIDHYNSLVFLNGPRDISAHADAVEQLQAIALSEGDSLNFIAAIRTELGG
ncbi:helix-turn-helix transcriptional regulator [Saccharopolyspora gloriosae]|uniref:Transcriptional regulator with XRE-family HTH domain n=1 Tax=Saccharopolyspora gloriosae TaxID=455344 RepID=A0A840N681_9PSEU|nr:helix-turn-helix transcriptional regulator [Saccharopolyspora gloriosae]MBB5067164.1 transcriptional regulator with XRE-family HTH domain [Saccharopolyspora gloriosae]